MLDNLKVISNHIASSLIVLFSELTLKTINRYSSLHVYYNSNVSFSPPCYIVAYQCGIVNRLSDCMDTSEISETVHLFLQHGTLPINLQALNSVYALKVIPIALQ